MECSLLMMENEEPRSKLPGNQGRTPLFSSHPDEDNGGTESESTDRFTGVSLTTVAMVWRQPRESFMYY